MTQIPAHWIACSRMYNVDETVFQYWSALFDAVAEISGIQLDIIRHRPPADIQELWQRADMGCVLMCGYPWALAQAKPRLLGQIVPRLPRYQSQAVYFTDFVVRDDNDWQQLEDSFGQRLGWTVAHSHSGYNAVRGHLLPYFLQRGGPLYQESLGNLISPVGCLDALLNQRADIVPLDSFYHDLLRQYAPERLAGTRTLATTAAAPFPPLVTAPQMADEIYQPLRKALLSLHEYTQYQTLLQNLGIAKIKATENGVFEVFHEIAESAIKAGYPQPI